MSNTLLIIDEDPIIAELANQHLKPKGFTIQVATDGESGLKKALHQAFDVIIMDVVLPKLNGLEVLKAIRELTDTPVLMLTSNNQEINKIIGLEIGADDYLPKPCSPRELLARLQAILRRTQKTPVHKPILEYQHIVVDCSKRVATISGMEIELTNAEFNILEMLIKSPGQAFSKEELTEYALGRKYTAYDRSIDVHISNLRNKLGDTAVEEELIKTVRGFGYILNG